MNEVISLFPCLEGKELLFEAKIKFLIFKAFLSKNSIKDRSEFAAVIREGYNS